MKVNLNVDVHHLARVEGHGNIKVRVVKGKIKEARWDVVETPRFFEVMLKGKHYTTAGILTARICGICSIGHCLASIRATEDAFGITVPEAASKLRLLAKHGETLQSHILHLFFLAAPDFCGQVLWNWLPVNVDIIAVWEFSKIMVHIGIKMFEQDITVPVQFHQHSCGPTHMIFIQPGPVRSKFCATHGNHDIPIRKQPGLMCRKGCFP